MRWSDIPWHPTDRLLRQFAALCLLLFAPAAMLQYRHERLATAAVAGVVAALGAVGLVRPRSIRWFFVAWTVVAFPIGWLVLNACLGVVFFGLITPLALLFRAIGRDPMERRWMPEAESYLEPKPATPPDRYYRTF